MVLIGRKNRKLTVERRGRGTPDAYGDIYGTDTWSSLGQFWGSVSPISGQERIVADQVSSDVTHKIFIRRNAVTATLTPADRIVYGTREFDIKSVLNVNDRDQEMQFYAVERI